MDFWYGYFLKAVADRLMRKPRLSVEEAIDGEKDKLVKLGLGEQEAEKIVLEMQNLGQVFHHKGVLNPLYLDSQLGKRTFVHMIDAREGRYTALRQFMENWQGEHSRFIVLGPEDAIIILYGTLEDQQAWTRYVAASNWPVDSLHVYECPRLKGYSVVDPSADDVDEIPVNDINQLVEDYLTPGLEDARSRLEEAKVLLGPTVLEDFDRTDRVRAFMAARIAGAFPASLQAYETWLLGQPQTRGCVRSIYHCTGRYHLVVELVCSGMGELNRVTDLAQGPRGAPYSVETTTFPIAATEVETLPTISLETRATWQEQAGLSGRLARKILTEFIVPKGAQGTRQFSELSDDEQLLLVQAIDQMWRIELPHVEADWEEAATHAKDAFVGSVLAHSVPGLKTSVGSLAPAVEAAGKRALRLTIEWLYLRDYGRAQKDLRLRHVVFKEYSLGMLEDAFVRINVHPYYQKANVSFPRGFLRRWTYFRELRNEFMHEVSGEFQDLVSETRDGLRCGLEAMSWIGTHIVGRRTLPLSSVGALVELIRSEEAEGILVDVVKNIQQSSEQIRVLVENTHQLEDDLRANGERMIGELTALSVVGAASTGQENLWRRRLDSILENTEEILAHIDGPAQEEIHKLLTKLGEAGESVALNLLASAIFYILLNVAPAYLPSLLPVILNL